MSLRSARRRERVSFETPEACRAGRVFQTIKNVRFPRGAGNRAFRLFAVNSGCPAVLTRGHGEHAPELADVVIGIPEA